MKILITSLDGELLFQYDSFSEKKVYDNALVTSLIGAIVALSKEVISSFPREIEYGDKILYFYNENDYIVALLIDTESPFNGNILPLLLAAFKETQEKYHFSKSTAIKYEKEIKKALMGYLAEYLSTMQQNMLNIMEKTGLTDFESLTKLKTVARQNMLNEDDMLSVELICRMIPDGLSKLLYGLVVGIPIIITGNRSISQQMAATLSLLCPTRNIRVKLWSNRYIRGYDIIATNDITRIASSPDVIIVNIDDGIVLGGRHSKYFEEISCHLCKLSTIDAFNFLRSELDWIFQAFEKLSINSFSKDSLPFEKQMILFELLKRLR